jgi:hypothetical protein
MNVNTAQNDTGVIKGNFRSCRLVRPLTEIEGVAHTTSLIPEKYAKVGRGLELFDGTEWVHWMVLTVSGNLVVDPVDSRVLIKSHRRATGDSMKRSSPTSKE